MKKPERIYCIESPLGRIEISSRYRVLYEEVYGADKYDSFEKSINDELDKMFNCGFNTANILRFTGRKLDDSDEMAKQSCRDSVRKAIFRLLEHKENE